MIGLALLLSVACGPAPQPTPVIAYSGHLTPDTPAEQIISGPGQEHRWTFTGRAGTVMTLFFEAEQGLPTVTLYDPDGNLLQEFASGSYANRLAITDLNAAADGDYLITIAMAGPGITYYTLTLHAAPNAPPESGPTLVTPPPVTSQPVADSRLAETPIAPATPAPPLAGSGTQLQDHQVILGRLREAGETERYTIAGRANDVITVAASPTVGSSVDPAITIFTPSGDILAQVDDTLGLPDAIAAGLVLPSTGAYVVFVQDANGWGTGTYELGFGSGSTMRQNRQEAPPPATVLSGLLGQPVTRDVWPIQLVMGDIISAAVVPDETSALDPVLTLLSPTGQPLYTDDNGGGGRSAALRRVIAPQTGEFYLAVSPVNGFLLGAYTLIWRYEAQAPVQNP